MVQHASKLVWARMRDQPISVKHAVEVARAVRGKKLQRAIRLLEDVIALRQPIAYRRYVQESAAHKPGIGPGRYPVKTAAAFLSLLKLAEANARHAGFDTEKLIIVHCKADKASRPFKPGRHTRRVFKRAHIEVAVSPGERA